ncbi:EAL domain-containing protein [Sphingomonas ginkgonis]|uniref:EAL domain-containing protein n=1 Tax=Sphingomonas ginkgonis TaxID=2315330 RepID=A0A3R9YL46_9SPHN|nr:EAL domain-containing protein [Sphingomonas ginkgonis]
MLFAGAMLAVSLALSSLIANNASQQVERQLQSSGAVYERLWQLRSGKLRDGADLLARDFGFRAAVATRDEATMRSALDNARARLNVGSAFIVALDGRVEGSADPSIQREGPGLWNAFDGGRLAGVAVVGGRVRQLAAAPVMAPNLIGWVVFAADLDQREMTSLERLSAIPLHADVLVRRGSVWQSVAGTSDPRRADAIVLTKPLPSLGEQRDGSVLMLAYPKRLALASARRLQWALALMTLLGLSLVAFATWRAAGSITRPLARLDEAAGRLARGEHAELKVEGEDELSRLAAGFNDMVVKIEERERRIAHLAFNDVLTGLPNRTMFHEHLGLRLRAGKPVALHCLDLDQFKNVNDTMGHPAGDALLVAVGERIAAICAGQFVARLGGDEFVVVQDIGENERGGADRLAEALIRGISEPIQLDGQMIVPSTSIGIALAPTDGSNAGNLLKSADLALYRAKEAGRGTFAFFEESLNERAQQRRQMENDLRIALERGEFELFYQPLFDLEKDRIGSFEALLRWNHPRRGLVSPVEFIPIAEETGLIVPLGAWALRQACHEATRWPDHVRVAVNVSSVQFHRPGLQEIIVQALGQSGLAPERLEIEITESIFLEGSEATLKLLHTLRTLGIRIALDDFGTGYSSLSYLQSFPFDKLKIDRSFIQNLLTRPGASAVVRAITDLAHALGMETTAEGVEERGQLAELRNQGCSSVQGFLFSKPMQAAEIIRLLDTAPARSASAA